MKKKLPRISDAEWLVMHEFWRSSPQTANAIVAALHGKTSWSPKTIKTLINRLVGKGALRFERQGREYFYTPLVSQDRCARAESTSLLRRVFGGALKPMLATFIEAEDLSPQDIDELKRLLDQKRKAKNGR